MPDSRTVRAPLVLLTVVLAAVAYAVSGWLPQLRFAYVPLNYWSAAVLSCLLPVALLWASLGAAHRALKFSGVALSALVAVPALVFAAVAWSDGSDVTNNVDTSFELISEGKVEPTSYRLYRTDCGATCAFGLVLREEHDLPLGIRLVTPVWSLYRAADGTVEVQGSAVRVVSGGSVLATIRQ